MGRMRGLFNHPSVLAPDPSAGTVLAFAPAIPVPNSPSRLDGNVGSRGRHHGALARGHAL